MVDGRFTCKITDYGLPRLYDAQKLEDDRNEKADDLLWTEPELLKDDIIRKNGTQVYISINVYGHSISLVSENLSFNIHIPPTQNVPAETVSYKPE